MGVRSYIKRLFDKYAPSLGYAAKNDHSIVVNKLDIRPVVRQSVDIQKWRSGLIMAESIGQYRAQLYDIYAEILLDGYLCEGLLGKRRMAVTNKILTFVGKDGKPVDDVVSLSQKSFFGDFLKHIIESRFWGHSLIELSWSKDGTGETILIPRKHVKPRYKIVTQNQWDTEGYNYTEAPFTDNCIAVGDSEDLGLLNLVAPYAIWKRADMGDWAEFVEVFGMPTVFAKYNNEQSREMLIQALDAMGSRGRAVMPNDAVIEYHEATSAGKGGGDVFDVLRQSLNEEMSITVLGNTMTTSEAKNSGYAQSKTHEKSQAEVHKDDCMFVIRVLNEKLNPFLTKIGFNTEGGQWQFVEEEGMTLTERLAIDMQVSTKVPVGKSYWYDKYKIPVPTADDMPDEAPQPPEGENAEGENAEGENAEGENGGKPQKKKPN